MAGVGTGAWTVWTAKGVGVEEYDGSINGSFKALFPLMHPENNIIIRINMM